MFLELSRLTGGTIVNNRVIEVTVTRFLLAMMQRRNKEHQDNNRYRMAQYNTKKQFVPKDVCYHCRKQLVLGDKVIGKVKASGKSYYHTECARFVHII